MLPQISQLFVYPIKSCAGISVSSFQFDKKGPLFDRRWMLVNSLTGNFLSQREIPKMSLITTCIENGVVWASQSFCDDLEKSICLPVINTDSESQQYEIKNVQVWDDNVQGYDCGDEIAQWFSQVLGCECRLIYQGENDRFASEKYAEKGTEVSFADGFPLLVVAHSSLEILNNECNSVVSAANFRPNVVVKNTIAFEERVWEKLETNNVGMKVVKPCERCVIPTINPLTAKREADILSALLKYCREDKKIYFGQNLTFSGLNGGLSDSDLSRLSLNVGDILTIV